MTASPDIAEQIAELEGALTSAERRARETEAAIRGGPDGFTGLAEADAAAHRVRFLQAQLRATRERAVEQLARNDNAPAVPAAPPVPVPMVLPKAMPRLAKPKAGERARVKVDGPVVKLPSIGKNLQICVRDILRLMPSRKSRMSCITLKTRATKRSGPPLVSDAFLTMGNYVGLLQVLARS